MKLCVRGLSLLKIDLSHQSLTRKKSLFEKDSILFSSTKRESDLFDKIYLEFYTFLKVLFCSSFEIETDVGLSEGLPR